jgi:hypothetical protein
MKTIFKASLLLTVFLTTGIIFAYALVDGTRNPAYAQRPLQQVKVVPGAPLGADLSNLSTADAKKYGVSGGVVVVRIHEGGVLSNQTKMREGFVITKIGTFPVMSVESVKYALSKQKSQFVIQGFYPGSKQVYYYTIHDF